MFLNIPGLETQNLYPFFAFLGVMSILDFSSQQCMKVTKKYNIEQKRRFRVSGPGEFFSRGYFLCLMHQT